MSLPHILLGMLKEPASGYDLKKRFGQSLAHFWRAELSQIYPTLKRLEERSLLDNRLEPSDKGPDRRVYWRTAAGTKEFRDWLIGGPDVGHERIAHLTQTFFLGQLDDHEQTLAFFAETKRYFENWLDEAKAVDAQWRRDDPRYPDALPDEAFYMQLTLRNGLIKLAAQVSWCEECIARIKARVEAQEDAVGSS